MCTEAVPAVNEINAQFLFQQLHDDLRELRRDLAKAREEIKNNSLSAAELRVQMSAVASAVAIVTQGVIWVVNKVFF